MNIHSNFLIISKLLCALCSLVYVSPSFGSDILVKINNTDRGKGPLCQHCCRPIFSQSNMTGGGK